MVHRRREREEQRKGRGEEKSRRHAEVAERDFDRSTEGISNLQSQNSIYLIS